jgi:hypothetical protein
MAMRIFEDLDAPETAKIRSWLDGLPGAAKAGVQTG